MTNKKHAKKSARQKKLRPKIIAIKYDSYHDKKSIEDREGEIIRQFHQIRQGYTSLLSDVSKELNLIVGWINSQAIFQRNVFKVRLRAHLSRN